MLKEGRCWGIGPFFIGHRPTGASIYYTVDGSAPTAESAEYESALTLSATTTVKAIAVKDGVASAVASKTFTKSEGGDDEPGGDDH